MKLEFEGFVIRSWTLEDAPALAKYATNPKIAVNLADGFPQPYSEENAKYFISLCLEQHPLTHFTIAVGEEAVGSIGFKKGLHSTPKTMELGFWLAEPFWKKGIMTKAVGGFVNYGFELLGLVEILAEVYVGNEGSRSVLEKNGFILSGLEEKSRSKQGEWIDVWYFSKKRAPNDRSS